MKGLIMGFLIAIASLQSCIAQKSGSAINRNQATTVFDAIIVPGIPYKDVRWGYIMKSRVLWAVYLYKQGYTRNIIFSGNAVHTPYTEAFIMGMYAEKLGVPKENIYYDTLAQHSTENVFYSYRLAERYYFKTVALATDRLQTFYLKRYLRDNFQNKITILPLKRKAIAALKNEQPNIDFERAKVRNFIPLCEKTTRKQRKYCSKGNCIDKYAYIDTCTISPDIPVFEASFQSQVTVIYQSDTLKNPFPTWNNFLY